MSAIAQPILTAQTITAEAFRPFGQVLWPTLDGQAFGPGDAQLNLSQGIPRLYLMTLQNRGLQFQSITRHQRCTQCLGALNGQEWLIAVAPPGSDAVPDVDQLQAFRIPGDCFIKLEVGTWHAGPYFTTDTASFYNLELSDTNLTDHDTCQLTTTFGVSYEIRP